MEQTSEGRLREALERLLEVLAYKLILKFGTASRQLPLVNSTPVYSRVRRIASSIVGAPAYAPVSILLTMSRWTPERSAGHERSGPAIP